MSPNANYCEELDRLGVGSFFRPKPWISQQRSGAYDKPASLRVLVMMLSGSNWLFCVDNVELARNWEDSWLKAASGTVEVVFPLELLLIEPVALVELAGVLKEFWPVESEDGACMWWRWRCP